MKQKSTLFLKTALVLISLPVLAVVIFGLYWLWNNPVNPEYALQIYPVLGGVLLTVFPFLFALYQAFQLLQNIDHDQAFSGSSVESLKKIKGSAVAISVIYAVVLPFIYWIAEIDDAPGLIIIGMVLILASAVVAVFAAVLQRLLDQAITIKSENDLTV
ncbi:DUF2975 domain-containing protein [Halobacillus fulvus]|nr:DUF2975 domain-containing protein [Halobacillus fulvus]